MISVSSHDSEGIEYADAFSGAAHMPSTRSYDKRSPGRASTSGASVGGAYPDEEPIVIDNDTVVKDMQPGGEVR